MSSESDKQAAAQAGAALVVGGMKVGLGTGSTAGYLIAQLGERIASGALSGVRFVATSLSTELLARECRLPLRQLNDADIDGMLDIAIDGADEISPGWELVKGGGGALLGEKIVLTAAERVVIIADGSKRVTQIGERSPIPLEVVPAAWLTVSAQLESLGFEVILRAAERKSGPVVTDHGNLLLDLRMTRSFEAAVLERDLCAIPGVVECGIFVGVATDVIIAEDSVVTHSTQPGE